MQKKSQVISSSDIPEHYLYWTFQRPSLLRKELHTVENNRIRIINTGRRNPDNGPDFQDATIQIDGVVFRGDIEFHVKWQHWYQHGHEGDLRYRQVILHILWETPTNLPKDLSRKFPHLVLSTALKPSLNRWLKIMKNLETDQESQPHYSPHVTFTVSQLEELAWNRFNRRCEEIRELVQQHGWEHSLYIGLGGALGYLKNKTAFKELVRTFPPDSLIKAVHPLQRSPLIFWILLCWQSGLFNRPMLNTPQQMHHRLLKVLFHIRRQFAGNLPTSSNNLIQWSFSRLRPYNSPYLRMAGYAQILYLYQNTSLFKEFLNILITRKALFEVLDRIDRLLCVELSPSFKPYFHQLLKIQQLPERSMGVNRCRQFVLNFLLPLVYVWAQNQHQEGFQYYIEGLFFQFPSVDHNHIVRHMGKQQSHLPKNRGFIQQAFLEYHQQSKFAQYS